MLNAIVDLERELEIIKRRVNSGELEGKIGEDETDRLEYIKEELQATLA
jgi:hypothetical protein